MTTPTAATPTPVCDLRLDYFGPADPFAPPSRTLALLAVVRNAGTAGLPDKVVQLRLFPVAHLDFLAGDTLPMLPALLPGQTAVLRWQMSVTNRSGVPLAGLLARAHISPAAPHPVPMLRSASPTPAPHPVPMLPSVSPAPARQPVPALTHAVSPPAANAAPATTSALPPPAGPETLPVEPPAALMLPAPASAADVRIAPDLGLLIAEPRKGGGASGLVRGNRAWAAGDTVGISVAPSSTGRAIVSLQLRDGKSWREATRITPIVEILSGEPGQIPWRETFRYDKVEVTGDTLEQVITLTGQVGRRWRAVVVLRVRPLTAAVQGTIHLRALRPIWLTALDLPRLLIAVPDAPESPAHLDGIPAILSAEPNLLPDSARICAAHVTGYTAGMALPSEPAFFGAATETLSAYDGGGLRILGGTLKANRGPVWFAAGESLEIPFRWFAVAGAETVRDALRFSMP